MDGFTGSVLNNGATILSAVFVLCASWYVVRALQRMQQNIPPGLPSIPILGSLPWLTGTVNHLTFHEFSRKYGKIYTINFGQQ